MPINPANPNLTESSAGIWANEPSTGALYTVEMGEARQIGVVDWASWDFHTSGVGKERGP